MNIEGDCGDWRLGRKKDQEVTEGPQLGRNQCACCKKEGHWAKNCPEKMIKGDTRVLTQIDMDSD